MERANTITVAALTGSLNDPASRFRVRQYIPRLAEQGVNVCEHIPFFGKSCGLPSPFKTCSRIPALFRSRHADLVWVSRELVQGYETFERLLKRPRVMDVDDAIWLSRPFGVFTAADIARAMDAVIAGNDYLAEYFSRYCRNVYVVPTAIDLNRYELRPDSGSETPKKFVIGWTGMASNYKYLKLIEKPLKRFLQDYPDAELLLVAQRAWKSREIGGITESCEIAPERIRFAPWSKENEANVLQEMSVGLMPLSDDKWTRGKCSFKMLQYMGVGLPVIVSPVGMNRDVLQKADIGFAANSPDEWYDALKTLYEDRSLGVKLGLAGRRLVEQFYNADLIAAELARIFKSVLGR